MKKLLPVMILGAFVAVQTPAFAQAPAKPAASAASAAKKDDKKAETKAPAKKEKKGGC